MFVNAAASISVDILISDGGGETCSWPLDILRHSFCDAHGATCFEFALRLRACAAKIIVIVDQCSGF